MKTTRYVVEMLNAGGLLDSRLVEIPEDGRDDGPELALAAIALITELGTLSEGDIFRIRYAR